MNKLAIPKESKLVYDIEWTSKPSILLKGVGKYCKCGCGKHIFSSNKSKVFAGSSCRRKYYSITKPNIKYHLTATLSLKLIENPKPHYSLFIYPMKKGGVRLNIPIYPSNKELWKICESFAKFRIKPRTMELTA